MTAKNVEANTVLCEVSLFPPLFLLFVEMCRGGKASVNILSRLKVFLSELPPITNLNRLGNNFLQANQVIGTQFLFTEKYPKWHFMLYFTKGASISASFSPNYLHLS